MFKKTQILSVMTLLLLATGVCHADSGEEKVKDAIDKASGYMKRAVDKLGDDLRAMQDYLSNYSWKGVLQGAATSGPVTLSDVRLNGYNQVVAVRPGEKIDVSLLCGFDKEQCSALSFYRAVIGYAGVGGQTTVGNVLGAAVQDKIEDFTLTAPQTPGLYQIRFRTVTSLLEKDALLQWKDESGKEPGSSTTIGIVYVH